MSLLLLTACGTILFLALFGQTVFPTRPTPPPNATQRVETVAARDVQQPTKAEATVKAEVVSATTATPIQDARRATQFAQLTALANPTATITDTPLATSAPPETWYMIKTGNLRSCPRIDCDQVAQLTAGTPVTLTGFVHGELYLSSDIWRQVDYQGQTVYVHSSLVGTSPPVATLPPVVIATQPGLVSVPPVPACPRTCATAVALGMSSSDAAKCPGLDGDGDGQACYGN